MKYSTSLSNTLFYFSWVASRSLTISTVTDNISSVQHSAVQYRDVPNFTIQHSIIKTLSLIPHMQTLHWTQYDAYLHGDSASDASLKYHRCHHLYDVMTLLITDPYHVILLTLIITVRKDFLSFWSRENKIFKNLFSWSRSRYWNESTEIWHEKKVLDT